MLGVGGAGLRGTDIRKEHIKPAYYYNIAMTPTMGTHLVPSPPETWFRGMIVGGSFRRV